MICLIQLFCPFLLTPAVYDVINSRYVLRKVSYLMYSNNAVNSIALGVVVLVLRNGVLSDALKVA